MKMISKSLIAVLALGGALVGAGPVSAQTWGDPGYGNTGGYGGGYNNSYRDPREREAIARQLVDTTCSGRRGYLLETRLRGEVLRGQIDRGTAGRIQASIDDLQREERRECRERDFYGVRDVGKDYIRIRAWMDQESGGYRGGYGGNYGGGYYRR